MDPRTPSEVEATGTLPVSGEGSVPLTEEEPAAPAAARPDWVDEARSGLTVPGKYLAYEDAGRREGGRRDDPHLRRGRLLAAHHHVRRAAACDERHGEDEKTRCFHVGSTKDGARLGVSSG